MFEFSLCINFYPQEAGKRIFLEKILSFPPAPFPEYFINFISDLIRRTKLQKHYRLKKNNNLRKKKFKFLR